MGYAYLNIEVLKLTEMMISLELVKHIKRPYFFFEWYIPQNYPSSRYLIFLHPPKINQVVDTDFNYILMVNNYIILYANFFDNSAISLVNVDVVFFSNFS